MLGTKEKEHKLKVNVKGMNTNLELKQCKQTQIRQPMQDNQCNVVWSQPRPMSTTTKDGYFQFINKKITIYNNTQRFNQA